jgi:hypothetical protein
MPPLKLLTRAALWFHHLLQARRDRVLRTDQARLGRLAECQRRLQRVSELAEQARRRGWQSAARRLQGDLLDGVRAVREAADQALRAWGRPVPEVPDPRAFVQELRQLEGEFGNLQIDLGDQTVCVTTEPIVLEGVRLGPFAIRLPWACLARDAGSHCFTVVALDPNPAAPNNAVTHPHVSHEKLCAGDATESIQLALEQGRLADAFCLVRGVLTHYNPDSPHVPLDEWDGAECHDCGGGARGEDLSYCGRCGYDYCDDCISGCPACGEARCYGCLDRCPLCEGRYCADCLTGPAHPGRVCCPGCLEACAACAAEVARAELDPETRRCRPCREGKPQPGRPSACDAAPSPTPGFPPTENPP